MIKGQTVKRLAALLLAVCLLLGAVPAVSDVERDEEGGTWDWDSGIYTDAGVMQYEEAQEFLDLLELTFDHLQERQKAYFLRAENKQKVSAACESL